jgi:Concanavalin A-like lectin/glucanases superfamily
MCAPYGRPEIWTNAPLIQNSGIENLGIKFPDELYAGHHYEPGWHAVWIGYCDGCWARNLRILDADRGIEVSYSTRAYVGNIYFGEPFRRSGVDSDPKRASGHYGIAFNSFTQDSLAENLDIDAHYVHNMSVSSFANGNVYSSSRTLTGSLDHHGAAPYDNVYTDIMIREDASDLFRNGGNSPAAGRGTTLWNIRRENSTTVDFPSLPTLSKFPVINLIGIIRWPTSRGTNRYIEQEVNTPSNIYEAQLAKRLGAFSGLAGYWKFDEGSGTTPQDSSGNGNHCVMSPPPAWTTGHINGALSFDGVDDAVNCGSGGTLGTLPQITVSAWVNLASAGEGGFGRILQKGNGGNPTAGWRLVSQTSNRIEFSVDYATADVGRMSVTNTFGWNTWTHMAATWAGSTAMTDVKIYINGVEVGYSNGDNGPGVRNNDNADALRIGNNDLGAGTINGKIDDVRIYNRVLSANEIQALANGATP